MYNEFNKHKKSDGVKWVVVFVAIILLATSVAAIATKGFTNADPFGWFSKSEEEPGDENQSGAIKQEGQTLQYNVYNSEMMLLSAKQAIAPQYVGNVLVELRAEVLPANAEVGLVYWTVEWVNPNSDWAEGKDVSEYLELEKHDELYATVGALQPFGEQIVVTVYSEYNPNATAQCYIDFSRKFADQQTLSGSDIFFDTTVMENSGSFGIYQIQPMTPSAYIDFYYTNGGISFSNKMTDVYTTEDADSTSVRYDLTMCVAFHDALFEAGIAAGEYPSTTSFYPGDTFTIADIVNNFGCGHILPNDMEEHYDIATINKLNQVLVQFAEDNMDLFYIDVVCTDSAGTHIYTYYFHAAAGELIQIPEAMTLDKTQVII